MNTLISIFMTLSVLLGAGYTAAEGYAVQTSKGEFLSAALKHSSETRYEGEISDYHWNESDIYTADYGTTLTKKDGEDFVVLTVDDIHLSDNGYRVFNSVFAEATLRRLVAEVSPDLILLPGDIVCGENVYYSVRRITDMMENFGVAWAPVFGNHDDEADCDLNFLAETMMKGPHCLMKKGDPEMGVGNYVVNIADPAGKIIETFVMMDSHHSQANEKQQKWYRWVCEGTRALSADAEVSLVQHIPLPEYQYAYDLYHSDSSKWTGNLNEKICCERDADGNPVQRGFFDVIKATGNTKFVFCAHEHMNDFSVEYEGVRLTYLMKIGKNSGYMPGFDGGSVIAVGEDGINRISHLTKSVAGFREIEKIAL